jgi:hypothetical protein
MTKTGDRRGWTPMDALRPSGPGTESNRARADAWRWGGDDR